MKPVCRKAGKVHETLNARRDAGEQGQQAGPSDEQVPVLVVADRSGATVRAVLPAVNADPLREVIAPVVDEDIVLVTDGHRTCPRCAAAIGVHHEALNLSRSERVRGAFHIQIAADPAVNNRHSRLKDFLRRYRGVATRYLDNYLRWFQRLELENASPRACLATAIARPCIQFETGPKLFREDKGIQRYRHTLRQNRLHLCRKLKPGGSSDRITMSVHRP